jgi:hypothetical protein
MELSLLSAATKKMFGAVSDMNAVRNDTFTLRRVLAGGALAGNPLSNFWCIYVVMFSWALYEPVGVWRGAALGRVCIGKCSFHLYTTFRMQLQSCGRIEFLWYYLFI